MNKSFIISPFCIMHYDNPETNTYHGFINYSIKIKTKSGENILKCPSYSHSLKKHHTFYAFSPMIRPIPTGLKLINAKKLNKNPYNTTKIRFAYDPFDIQQDSVSFITWTQPVDGTVPLYLHISPSGYSYPSFDINPPSKGKWTKNKLSPIYVLVNPYTHTTTLDSNLHELPKWKKDTNGNLIFKFTESDNRCIPDPNGVSIEQCFLETDVDVLNKNIFHSGVIPLLTKIEKLSQHSDFNIQNFFKHVPNYAIIISITLFILSLITCIIILSKKKKK